MGFDPLCETKVRGADSPINSWSKHVGFDPKWRRHQNQSGSGTHIGHQCRPAIVWIRMWLFVTGWYIDPFLSDGISPKQ